MDDRTRILSLIKSSGLIPIIRTSSADLALGAARTLKVGGAKIIEVTFSVPDADQVISQLAEEMGDEVLVGAGTVLDSQTVQIAIQSGAQFIVSPGLDLPSVETAHKMGKPIIPGCLTPTEIMTGVAAGADMIKLFPADLVGGPKYIKAIKGPLPHVEIIPTGGVYLDNIEELIHAGASALGVGTRLVNKEAVAQGKWEIISENMRLFQEAVDKARASLGG